MSQQIDWSAVKAYHEELIQQHHERAATLMARLRLEYDPALDIWENMPSVQYDRALLGKLRRRMVRLSRQATPFEARIFGLRVDRRSPEVRIATADVLFPPLGGAWAMTLLVPRDYEFTLPWPRTVKASHSLVVLEDRVRMYELAELYRFQEGAFHGGFRHYLYHGTIC